MPVREKTQIVQLPNPLIHSEIAESSADLDINERYALSPLGRKPPQFVRNREWSVSRTHAARHFAILPDERSGVRLPK